MSYPSQKRRLRPARALAALVAALMAGGAGLASLPAQAVPTLSDAAGTIRTMGGVTSHSVQGGYGPEDVLGTESQFKNPRGLGFAPNGDLYLTDALNHRVRRIDAAGVVRLVAGNGTPGYSGDAGDAKLAQLNEPHGVAVDSEGNTYIADSKNCVIRKVTPGGIISTFAGTGAKNPTTGACLKTPGGATTNGPVLSIALDQPKSLFMTTSDNKDTLWIADMGNSQIRKIELDVDAPQNVRVAGENRARHYSTGGPNSDALDADLRHPEGVWVANDGTIYFTDGGNNLVRKIDMPAQNSQIRRISTIAGDIAAAEANAFGADDLPGNSDGDGGPALNAHVDKPRGIAGDNQGNLYVAEEHGSRIRRIKLNGGTIDTIGGDGTILEQRANGGSAFIPGENGPALQTQFAMLHDIQFNPADRSLWIADSRNNRVRAIADAVNAPGASIPTGGNTPPPTQPPAGGGGNPVPVPGKSGYWMLGVDGKVYGFGDAVQAMFGDAVGQMPGGARAIHIEPTPTAKGYWINDDRGGVYPFGDAAKLGGINTSALQAGEQVTSLSATPSGAGYWIFTSKGRVFNFGDAGKFGDLAHLTLNGAIQSSIPTPSGKGYFMVGSDGGVFAFGDAVFKGSMGATKLNQPVMSLVPTRDGSGYWLVASDGGIFAFNAPFKGSMGDRKLNKPVVGMVRYGNGYLMAAADGGIFSFSEKGFAGSLGNNPPARPISFTATLDS